MRAPIPAPLVASLALALAACAGSPAAETPDATQSAPADDAGSAASPADFDPASLDLGAMLQETRTVQASGEKLRLVWWLPVEYWETSFAQEASRVDLEQARMVLQTLRPFALFGVATADVAADGALAFAPEDAVRASLRLDTPTRSQRPLPEEEIPDALRSLLAGMRPALARRVEVGNHLYLFVFENRSETGEPLLSPRQPGFAELVVGDEGFRWTLPLGSFLPPKTCPVDQEPMSGAWTWCPYHGVRLE